MEERRGEDLTAPRGGERSIESDPRQRRRERSREQNNQKAAQCPPFSRALDLSMRAPRAQSPRIGALEHLLDHYRGFNSRKRGAEGEKKRAPRSECDPLSFFNLTRSKQSSALSPIGARLFRALSASRSVHSPALSRPRTGGTIDVRRLFAEKEGKKRTRRRKTQRTSREFLHDGDERRKNRRRCRGLVRESSLFPPFPPLLAL